MKIINVVLGTYTEGWGYQENILPIYQHKLGNDVWIITLDQAFGTDGKGITIEPCEYYSENGVHIIRLKSAKNKICQVLNWYNIKGLLKRIEPDFIFYHDMFGFSIWQVIRYIRKYNPACRLVVDNHEDEYNHPYARLSIKGKILYRLNQFNSRMYMPYIDKVYGVTEGRCEFAKKVYGAPTDKTELLLMGVEDEKVRIHQRIEIRKQICQLAGFDAENDFIIISGGKMDQAKGVLELLDAFKAIKEKMKAYNIKLLLFGSVADSIRQDFFNKTKSQDIYYMGFLNTQQIYDVFVASDLGVFPGGHSVLWEQAVGCGLPCLFRRWNGMTHVDVGGNCIFVDDSKMETIQDTIEKIFMDRTHYEQMRHEAVQHCMEQFSYFHIAKKSLELT